MHLNYFIGETLQSFREYKNLTIEELAEGICSKEDLELFERDKAFPTLETLNQFANKLNIDISDLINVASKSTYYTTAVIQIIERYKRERNYHAIFNIIKQEVNNPAFKEANLKQFLLWHEGICVYYLYQELEKAIKLLYKSISITNPSKVNLSERETEILNSIAILHYENQDYDNALNIFLEALTNLDKLPHILNHKVKIRVLFGLSQVFTELGNYEESINYCHKGIDLCINEDSLYCLNEFHYQMGENYIKSGDAEKGKEYLEECLYLLKLERKTGLLEIIQEEVNRLINYAETSINNK
ncbi:helix-turn-helix transcriptional regulator [Cytobacillus pseudoceanisediminis]|uniref:helix-turn-helix domain-containing protein n=1 Tax=Cytobacillus pseudoceanisediminis TaxID=3051614 RepID=UPI001114E115